MYKELTKEWDKRRQKWPEPLAQILGNITIGTGTFTVKGATIPARYEIWLTPSEQSNDQFRWGGEIFLPRDEVRSELMDTDEWLNLEDGRRGRVHIGGTFVTSESPDIKLTVAGLGSFPRIA